MNETKIILFLLAFILVSCQPEEVDLGIAADYLPPQDLLRQGVVNKYYEYEVVEGSPDTSVILYYRAYQMIGEKLHISIYEHADKKETDRIYRIENNQFILENDLYFFRGDTVRYSITDSISADWNGQNGTIRKTGKFETGVRKVDFFHYPMRDSIINGISAIKIPTTDQYIFESEKDTFCNDYSGSVSYVKGIGIFQAERINENGKARYWSELVEQFTLNDFLKQSDPSITRVGSIDTLKTLDRNTIIELCKTNNYIYDYYNGRQPLHYENGKGGQWKVVEENIDPNLTHSESGYLTFRFIVNCQGEASRYIVEEADLDFQKKKFSQKTIDHFYEITQKMTAWIPTVIRGEPVDAYFYITYKLDQGKVIEILP